MAQIEPTSPSAEEVRAKALADRYRGADAVTVLRAAIEEEFPGDIALVSSFGAESAVLLHLVAQVAPDLPVLFIDTGKHFAQTPIYRRNLAKKLGLTNVRDLHPAADEVAVEDPDGDLWRRDPDACCTLRKVRPLDSALRDFGTWITGRKQFHGGQRVDLPTFEHKGDHFKVNPIVSWGPDEVEAYFAAHDLPRHPLVDQGFPSIGCWPCTHPVATGDDNRAGRWRGSAKTECGIHTRL
ncbi:phosphoadenosine phosphosulfate reductase [Parvularcula bermudensis HTCC2503]|uniref:Adenosine 5'-phosphosulfate reductase n=1 Tax=Parvularcula bermudensis (strain ATCC BAA-594 / HTCC2503 / KCTC 12087) TaxID=314260 RepID=E0TFQ6_PARBH|nr:phosphoadenosine phosphosulfate reductase [Parvularcula bermudensis HTCC2503]